MQTVAIHLALTVLSFAAVWVSAGSLLGVVQRVARRAGRSSFLVSFFLLGLLTSFSEISVAINATLDGVPAVSAGNLMGASIVLFLLVAPVLAIAGGGVRLDHGFSERNLAIVLTVIAAPAFFVVDGAVTALEGFFLVLLYAALVYRLGFSAPAADERHEKVALGAVLRASSKDLLLVVAGAAVIFLSGGQLVREAVFFGELFSLPASFFGLLVLSVGTNIPELTIAVRAAIAGKKSAAMGDYVGSAAVNVSTLGILAMVNGGVILDRAEFLGTAIVLCYGLLLFFLFSKSKSRLSRAEGAILIGVYGCFLIWQLLIAR